MNRVKPCPFCGGEATIQQDTRYPRYGKKDTVKAYEPICINPDCHIYKADRVYFLSESEAISAWNNRTSSKIDNNSTLADMTRCSDCKNWDKSISFMGAHACAFWSNSKTNPRYTQEFEFCSFAESKGE